MKYKQHIQIR